MNTGTENQNLKLIGVFLIGVVVGGFSFWMWSATEKALLVREGVKEALEEEVVTEEVTSEKQEPAIQNIDTRETQIFNDSIVVRNQAPGLRVNIDKAVLEENGWVVIHEGTASHIGNALGAARFDAGEHSGVVELLRATETQKTYWAVLYRDNGDKEFNLDSDFPFLQNGNSPVLTTFIVE